MNLQKYEILKEIIYIYNPKVEDIVNNSIKFGSKITLENFLKVISKDEYSLAKDLNVNESSISRFLKRIFPDRTTKVRPDTYLLGLFNYKYCHTCKQVRTYDEFHSNKSRADEKASECKYCAGLDRNNYQREYQKRRKAIKEQRLPKWADLQKIKEIYNNCPKDMQVDHIIPLKGELVSGLHVETNLQYLTPKENQSKGNRYTI